MPGTKARVRLRAKLSPQPQPKYTAPIKRRRRSPPARSHCAHGHELTPSNTYVTRSCRICLSAYAHWYHASKKQKKVRSNQRVKKLRTLVDA